MSQQDETSTDWRALQAMRDEDIRAGIEDDPDAQATDAAFWQGAKRVTPRPLSGMSQTGGSLKTELDQEAD